MAGPLNTLALLGATGSIGGSTLDVVARHPDRFRIGALSAHSRVDELLALCARFRPDAAVITDPAGYGALRDGLQALGLPTRAMAGPAALDEVAADPANDIVVAAIVGAAGMASTLAAARAGKRLLLANKESVVLAGDLLMQAVREGGATLLPVDSEHNAIYQCLPADGQRGGVRRLLLTASGGPFRGRRREDLADITPDQACAHPNWVMGRKISVDSATLMNKGLEVIEARHLFGLPASQIEVVVHPQSVIHSLVDYVDGSVLAQLGNPDMRTALAYGLAWPERIDSGVAPLDLTELARFDFEPPDRAAFPCLDLAYRALEAGGSAPAVLNAANEIAVSAFLQGQLGFLGIPDLIRACLDAHPGGPAGDLDQLMQTDADTRRAAESLLPRMRKP
ncbi:1-deoxy-D-xylulose-5-phosphate reductoisomerase [Arenimonas sp. MALMAid1274]|uniref:1-deoxy-D-xylulose-5-phosphate reductoisomerase n=1 Tax=Arenimonas sp. MALMAid1274 TaxID=3411630 RepID=UPI003BA0C5A0